MIAILEQFKYPKRKSSKCRDSDLLPNRLMNNMVYNFLKSNGIPWYAVIVSSNGSNSSSFSSQPLASSISLEHEQDINELKEASNHKPSIDSSVSNTNLLG